MNSRALLILPFSLASISVQAGDCIAFHASAGPRGLREPIIIANDLAIGRGDGPRTFVSNDHRLVLTVSKVAIDVREGKTGITLSASLALDGKPLLKADAGTVGTFGNLQSTAYLADGSYYGLQCQELVSP